MVLFEHPASIPTEQYDGVVAPMWLRVTLIVQAHAVSLHIFFVADYGRRRKNKHQASLILKIRTTFLHVARLHLCRRASTYM